jgi:hypothetical protein
MNLMEKYLRKVQENDANDTLKPKSQDAPVAEDNATSRQVFEKGFKELADKLSHCALTADEIQTQKPEIYKKIQEAINEMDSTWLKEDLRSFSKAVKTIEELYYDALREIPEG